MMMFVQFTIPRETVELGRIIDTCVARCVERWGGCTVTDGIGYWQQLIDHENPISTPLVVEPVAILNVECDLSGDDGTRPGRIGYTRDWFDNLAVFVRTKGAQHTAYYRMFDGGEGRFVGPDTIIAPKAVQA